MPNDDLEKLLRTEDKKTLVIENSSKYNNTKRKMNSICQALSMESRKYDPKVTVATVYKGNIIKNLIMDCQSYTKYRPNETTGGIFVSWRRKEELPTGA